MDLAPCRAKKAMLDISPAGDLGKQDQAGMPGIPGEAAAVPASTASAGWGLITAPQPGLALLKRR